MEAHGLVPAADTDTSRPANHTFERMVTKGMVTKGPNASWPTIPLKA